MAFCGEKNGHKMNGEMPNYLLSYSYELGSASNIEEIDPWAQELGHMDITVGHGSENPKIVLHNL
jgi:hypothetical protein